MTDRPLAPGSTLLVDLDGVVAEQLPQLCTYLRREYDHDVEPDDIDDWSYEVPEAEGHIGDIIGELMTDHAEWYFGGMDPQPGVADTLSTLRSEYRVEIATHRIPETHDVSKAWLDTHGIGYDDFHDEVPNNKGALAGDALIDDYHGNVADALSAGKAGFLMQQPYSDPCACDGAHVVTSWDDVRTLLSI
ncbi:5' nucleotidase, NT5C type [Natronomonas sp.]|jgi:5'(3')-deoxyribonucleotidase|uniref:5' nucleotidase, NT5C type n=1 Tax=Natronomonas sp. TaxID=2184060 RepID=UPI00398A3D49